MPGQIRTRDDIFTEVLVRNNRSTTDAFITDTMLKQWFFAAHTWAMSYHKWPFTEGRVSTTFAAGLGDNGDEWYFEGYKADSFRLITIGGKALKKLNFTDYKLYVENEPAGTERVCANFGRALYINPNVDLSGTLTAWGQYNPYVDVTDETGLTLFSDYDQEGNEAIVLRMTAYLKNRENATPTIYHGKPVSPALIAEQNALEMLENVWKRIEDEQYGYQTHPDRQGIFSRFDILSGRYPTDLNNPNRFSW